MKFWFAVLNDTDGYTYSCEILLGMYETKAEADERCLKWCEEHKRNLEDFESVERGLGDWDDY